jgi:diguanylate cyclase (GGDEF)-like protein
LTAEGKEKTAAKITALPVSENTTKSVSQNNKSIVLVETKENFAQTSRLLGDLGFNVETPETCQNPSLCPLALVNPEADPGLDACLSLSAHCKVMLVTNNRDFQFKIEAVHKGATGLMSFPLNAVEVLSSLEEDQKDNAHKARILIIDDDELTSSVYALALEECGLRVIVLSNPLQAEKAISEFRPDLILLDIDMPQANGLDVARAIRLDPQYTSLPILFLSSVSDKLVQDQARQVGGDDFIKKPVDIGYLVKMVRMRAERSIELRQIMVRDGLTGLLNHVSFKEKLAAELQRSARSNKAFAVALLDLDHFKTINDCYGHQVGDTVIQTFASHLKCSLRNIDVVGRYGGEEFAVILLDADVQQACRIFDRIRAEFESIEFHGGEKSFGVTFSCGVVGSIADCGSEALLTLADLALYEAKASGRNQVREYLPGIANRFEH